MAPEIIENGSYGVEVDIWAMGVVLYTIHTLYLPFQAKTVRSMFKQVMAVSYDKDKIRHKAIKTIVKACLKKDI